MTTIELLEGIKDYSELRGLFIILTPQQNDIILSVQDPESKMRVTPILLKDGRYAISADILTEIHPNGIFYESFKKLTLNSINESEVVPAELLETLKIVEVE